MKNKDLTYRMVLIAMCAAIFVVLDRFVKIELFTFKFTLSALPVIIIALLYGPVDGLLVGLLGSFISQVLSEYGLTITTPLWMLPAIVRGLLVGLCKNKSKKAQIIVILLSSLVVTGINTGVMIIDSIIFNYASDAMNIAILISRIVSGLVCGVLYCIVAPRVVNALKGKVKDNG